VEEIVGEQGEQGDRVVLIITEKIKKKYGNILLDVSSP